MVVLSGRRNSSESAVDPGEPPTQGSLTQSVGRYCVRHFMFNTHTKITFVL